MDVTVHLLANRGRGMVARGVITETRLHHPRSRVAGLPFAQGTGSRVWLWGGVPVHAHRYRTLKVLYSQRTLTLFNMDTRERARQTTGKGSVTLTRCGRYTSLPVVPRQTGRELSRIRRHASFYCHCGTALGHGHRNRKSRPTRW